LLNDVPLGTTLYINTTVMRKTADGTFSYVIKGNLEKSDEIGVRIYDGVTAIVIPWHAINHIEWNETRS
jgi:hypothetical protein